MRWGLIPYWAKDIKIGFSTRPRARFSANGQALRIKNGVAETDTPTMAGSGRLLPSGSGKSAHFSTINARAEEVDTKPAS